MFLNYPENEKKTFLYNDVEKNKDEKIIKTLDG